MLNKEILKMTWMEFDEARKEADFVIIPVGSIEVFGPHMPVGCDTLIAERLARRISEMVNAVVAPVVPIGYARSLMEFPGTLSVTPAQLESYLTGICKSLIDWGFKKILFFNVHRGNVPTVTNICMEYLKPQGIKCSQVYWWQLVEANTKHLVSSTGHGGEACTAVMLEVAPELINLKAAVTTLPKWKTRYPDIFGYWNFRSSTDTGLIGDPLKADAEQGKEMVKLCIDRIVSFINEEFLG